MVIEFVKAFVDVTVAVRRWRVSGLTALEKTAPSVSAMTTRARKYSIAFTRQIVGLNRPRPRNSRDNCHQQILK